MVLGLERKGKRKREEVEEEDSELEGKSEREAGEEEEEEDEEASSNFDSSAPQLAWKMSQRIEDRFRSSVLALRLGVSDENLGLPKEFQSYQWPAWKDSVFAKEMKDAKYKVGVYRDVAKHLDYSWKYPQLWVAVSASIEDTGRADYSNEVNDEKIFITSADDVKDRARLYKNYLCKLLMNDTCMMETRGRTSEFQDNVKAVFTTGIGDALPLCVVPIRVRPKSDTDPGRSTRRAMSNASSSHASQVVISAPGNELFAPHSSHYQEVHSLCKVVESHLKQLFPSMREDVYWYLFRDLSVSDGRMIGFLSGDDERKKYWVQQILGDSSYAQLNDTSGQLILGDTQPLDH